MRPSSLIALAVVTVPVVYAAPTADAVSFLQALLQTFRNPNLNPELPLLIT